jgi:3-oxoacyl-[acyl-carrier-protein] synthase-1
MLHLADMGVISALGRGKAETLRRLLEPVDAARPPPGLQPYGPLLTGRSTMVAAVRDDLAPLPPEHGELDCRNNRLLAAALDEIAPAVAALRDRYGPTRIAVVMGTSTSGIASGEDAAESFAATGRMPESYHYRQQEIGSPAELAARYLGLEGLRYTISTACSSSAKAFASAQRLLAAGRCDAAIVGGADSLCRLTLNGFDALESLARGAWNPLSANRHGITIGEGACVFVVTREPAAVRLLGVGESSDGHHMSAPDPTGKGAELAIRAALAAAGVAAEDVGYVNLHGTATPKNDEMEAHVIARVFGGSTPCSSTKALTGHALGAAGALELGICWLLLGDENRGRRLPAHVWDGVSDPALPPIGLVEHGEDWRRGVFVSNSFAFGGSNTAIVIGRS